MPNNIANKLVVNAKTQAEIEDYLSAITSIDGDETLQIDFEKSSQCLSACQRHCVITKIKMPFTTTL